MVHSDRNSEVVDDMCVEEQINLEDFGRESVEVDVTKSFVTDEVSYFWFSNFNYNYLTNCMLLL